VKLRRSVNGIGEGLVWADSVEKLFAAADNFQKAENCSPIARMCHEKSVKFEMTRILFC
jgi:hypothetical protein